MKKIKIKTKSYSIIKECLEYAAERACNRCDKYNDVPLTITQRTTLISEFENSFWLALEDRDAEIV
jgi:hypothetical protein